MTYTESDHESSLTDRAHSAGSNWRAVLRITLIAGIVECLLLMAVVEKAVIPPVIILGVLFAVALVRMRTPDKGIKLGTVAMGLFVLASLLNIPDLLVPASYLSFSVAVLAIVTGVVGLVAGIAVWRGSTATSAPRWFALAGAGVAAALVITSVIASVTFSDAKLVNGDVAVKAKDSTFAPNTLSVDHGQVTFFLDNSDNTLHNFHLKGVGGDPKTMPAGHQVRYTVNLQPGTYSYVCDLHDDMTGTLTVK